MQAVAAGAPVRSVEPSIAPVAAAPQDTGFALALDTAFSRMAVPVATGPVGGASIPTLTIISTDTATTTKLANNPVVSASTLPSILAAAPPASPTPDATPKAALPIAPAAVAGDPNEMPRQAPAKLEEGAEANAVGKERSANAAPKPGTTEAATDTPKQRLVSPKRSAPALPLTTDPAEPTVATAPLPLPVLAVAASTVTVAIPTGRQTAPTRAGETKVARSGKSELDLGATQDLAVPATARESTPVPVAMTTPSMPPPDTAAPREISGSAVSGLPASSITQTPAANPPGSAPASTVGARLAEASPDRDVSPAPDIVSASPAALPLPGQVTHASRPVPPLTDSPIVKAQPGQLGHEIGVQIAHRVAAGSNELIVRLDPPTLGRIEVRMTFDDRASLRAVFTADNAPALDMLRRDGADLTRALSDAGIRSDAQTLRFDSRGGDSGGQPRHAWQKPETRSGPFGGTEPATDTAELAYRNVRTSGRYDLMA